MTDLERKLDLLFVPSCDPYRAGAAALLAKAPDAVSQDERDIVRRVYKRIAAQHGESKQVTCTLGDDPFVDILHRALGNRTGKLRVSDAYRICGIEPGKTNQAQISRFGRAIRELGWERKRMQFEGSREYVYVKGNAAEREVEFGRRARGCQ
jgi:hypothetical protein